MFKYNAIASILKWLTLSLFAYIIMAFIAPNSFEKTKEAPRILFEDSQ
jgi:hypothetical protein